MHILTACLVVVCMENNPLDEVVARIRLGDPAGETVNLTGRTLCQNVLVTGMVGSGKTTSVVYPILKDVIAHHADDPVRKIGLFVFDSKTDGTTERVMQWADACGRSADVMVIGEGSRWGYYPFHGIRLLSEIEIVAAKIHSGFMDMGGDNLYWERTTRSGIEAVLALEMIENGILNFHSTLAVLSEILLGCPSQKESNVSNQIDAFSRNLDKISKKVDAHSFRMLSSYQKTLHVWRNLDPKTKGILQTCVGNALGPLLTPRVSAYYPMAGRTPVDISRIVTEGKIVILCTNASANTDIAATLGRLIKADLYRAIQLRSFTHADPDRLVGLFLDEYPLVASANQPFFGDVQNLQTMREKRAFVVAGTQGYVSMHNTIGVQAWQGLRINFASNFYLRSNEPEVDEHARTILGLRDSEESVQVKVDDLPEGNICTSSQSNKKISVKGESWIVKQGALSRLDTHEAFFSIADGQRSESPVFIIPVFETPKKRKIEAFNNPLDIAAALFRNAGRPTFGFESSDNDVEAIFGQAESPKPALLPLFVGNRQSGINIITLDQEFSGILDSQNELSQKPTDKRLLKRIRNYSFTDIIQQLDDLTGCGPLLHHVVKKASAAVLDYSRTFIELSKGNSVNRTKLAESARVLYKELGVSELSEQVDCGESSLANQDNKLICATTTSLNLDHIPEHAFSQGAVAFFSMLKEPIFQSVLPPLIIAAWHDGIPLAVFEPSLVAKENSLLIAAAHVSFASCLSPNRYFLSPSNE